MRHYWVDRIVACQLGVRASGIKSVALSEDFFEDHFPGNPIYPGIYIIEGVAQTAGYLLHESSGRSKVAVLASIDRARFLAFARPGDRLRFEVSIESQAGDAARVVGEALVDDRRTASLRLTFQLVPMDRLIAAPYQGFWEAVYAGWRGEFPGEDG